MSIKSTLAMAVAATALFAVAAPASAGTFVYSLGAPAVTIPGVNDFKANLSALGYKAESIGAHVSVLGKGKITFEFLGTESKFHDTFNYPGLASYTELFSTKVSYFGAPVNLGSIDADTGPLAVLFNAIGYAGTRSATQGQAGFALFLPTITSGAGSSNVIYFGYDDKISPTADDNHDDMIIRATISAVPEPTVWAMLISGFALMGAALRRRPRTATAAI